MVDGDMFCMAVFKWIYIMVRMSIDILFSAHKDAEKQC